MNHQDNPEEKKVLRDESSQEEYSFMQETIKDSKGNRRKTIMRTAGLGLIFGLAASLGFFALKPLVENTLSGDAEHISIAVEEEPEDAPEDASENGDEKEKVEEAPIVTLDHYREMNEALTEIGTQAQKSVASIKATVPSEDEQPITVTVSGMVAADNGKEFLIFASNEAVKEDGKITVEFADMKSYPATVKSEDTNIGYAVYAVEKSNISKATEKLVTVAELGSSANVREGQTAIVLGSPFGYSHAMGFGVVASSGSDKVNHSDGEYSVIGTDIAAVPDGSGILVDIDGKVIGMVDQRVSKEGNSLVTGYGVSDLKKVIEILCNGESVPYIGIVGIAVTDEMAEEQGIPKGLYVQEVKPNSPAMEAGIQRGDVLVKMDDAAINSLNMYRKHLMDMKIGYHTSVHVMRQGKSEYEEIEYRVTVGTCK